MMSEEEKKLLDEILTIKIKNTLLIKKKRVLTEELFQQYLEAEIEPKKKKKVGIDTKKKKNSKKNEEDGVGEEENVGDDPIDDNGGNDGNEAIVGE